VIEWNDYKGGDEDQDHDHQWHKHRAMVDGSEVLVKISYETVEDVKGLARIRQVAETKIRAATKNGKPPRNVEVMREDFAKYLKLPPDYKSLSAPGRR